MYTNKKRYLRGHYADYSSEIKLAIFQSISEHQRAKWWTIESRSTIFTFYPYLSQKLLDRFSPSF